MDNTRLAPTFLATMTGFLVLSSSCATIAEQVYGKNGEGGYMPVAATTRALMHEHFGSVSGHTLNDLIRFELDDDDKKSCFYCLDGKIDVWHQTKSNGGHARYVESIVACYDHDPEDRQDNDNKICLVYFTKEETVCERQILLNMETCHDRVNYTKLYPK